MDDAERPIDAVPWGPNDPQEDELGLARLSIDTNMAGMAFPLAYPWFFRRNVLGSSAAFERQWLHFTKLTWLHDGYGKAGLLIKNSAHSARVELVLRHFPRARFVLLRRDRQDSIRSLVQVKQRLGSLVGLQPLPDAVTQVEETVAAHRKLLEAFEASRHRIPAGQLVELPYEELIRHPLAALKRIYDELGLSSWPVAQAPLRLGLPRPAATPRSGDPALGGGTAPERPDGGGMTPAHDRRQRLHELVIALIAQQDDLPLLDPDQPDLEGTAPGRWLDQNRRSLHRYQALVRTAVTLDALLDAEDNPSPLSAG